MPVIELEGRCLTISSGGVDIDMSMEEMYEGLIDSLAMHAGINHIDILPPATEGAVMQVILCKKAPH